MNEPTMKKVNEQERAGAFQPAGSGLSGQPSHPHTLSGQQMTSISKQYADQLTAIKRDVELRKWAVDQAVGLVGAWLEGEVNMIPRTIALSREIHAFLVEGAEKAE